LALLELLLFSASRFLGSASRLLLAQVTPIETDMDPSTPRLASIECDSQL